MDLSLKQRLLGAIVLIALAVIFVPMFLSGPGPQPASETVNLAIPPAPDREFQNRVLPVEGAKDASTSAAPAVTTSTPLATVETPPRPAEIPQPTTPTTTTPSTDVGKPQAVETATAPATTSASAKPAETEPGRAGSGRFYVHLGIYAATKNADDLVAALKKGGFPAFAEASDYQGKPAERVRVGPYEDRAAAEAARLRIKQVKPDVPGSVVQLAGDVTAEAPAPTLPANRAGGYAVQLGAFKTVEEANKVRDRLKGAGFAAYVDKVAADSGTLWRVRAGPEADRGDADKLRGRIKDKMKLDGMVVTQQ